MDGELQNINGELYYSKFIYNNYFGIFIILFNLNNFS